MKLWRRLARRPATVAIAAFAAFVFVFHFCWHEPWRDESQAILIARGTSLRTLVAALRYEGHPPLPYLLLDLVAPFPAPFPLAFLGAVGTVALLGGTYALLRAMGASPRAALAYTCLVGCTYVYVYELGVVARAYGLGLGLTFWMMALMQDALATGRTRSLAWAGVVGAASALTSATAAVYVVGAAAVFAANWVLARPRRVLGLAWLAPIAGAVEIVHKLLAPVPDRWIQFEHIDHPDRTWRIDWNATRDWLHLVFGAGSSDTWWPTKLEPHDFERALAGLQALVVVTVALHGLRFIRQWRTALFVPIASALQMAGFFYCIYYRGLRPDYRHWAFPMGTVLVALGGHALVADRRAFTLSWLRRASLLLLAPWIWVQLRGAWSNLEQDYGHPFSLTARFARVLPHGARVVSDREVFGTSIEYWRPDAVMRSTGHRGRYYTYVRWDKAEAGVSERDLALDECGKTPTGTVYFFGGTGNVPPQCVSTVDAPYDGPKARTDEYDRGFVVSCACLQR